MKKLFYTLCAGLTFTAATVTPVKVKASDVPPFDLKNQLMGVSVLALAGSYAYAMYKYGVAQVNAIGFGTAATIGGLLLGNKLAAADVAVTLAKASQVPFGFGNYVTSPFAIITAAILGAVTYKTVHAFLDTSDTVTFKKV